MDEYHPHGICSYQCSFILLNEGLRVDSRFDDGVYCSRSSKLVGLGGFRIVHVAMVVGAIRLSFCIAMF